jgi:hypothetical protein
MKVKTDMKAGSGKYGGGSLLDIDVDVDIDVDISLGGLFGCGGHKKRC